MEEHHFKVISLILANPETNIFSDLKQADFEEVLKTIRMCVLSAEQKNLVGVFNDIKKLVNHNRSINTENLIWKERIVTFLSNLSSLYYYCLPWKEHKSIIELQNLEILKQDELLKQQTNKEYQKLSITNKELVENQIRLFNTVILPSYEILGQLFPSLMEMYEDANRNYNNWKSIKIE